MSKQTITDLLRDYGRFDFYDSSEGGTVVDTYTIDDIEYVEVEFSGSPGMTYTYLSGE